MPVFAEQDKRRVVEKDCECGLSGCSEIDAIKKHRTLMDILMDINKYQCHPLEYVEILLGGHTA